MVKTRIVESGIKLKPKLEKKKKAEEKYLACEMFHVEHELTLKFNFSK